MCQQHIVHCCQPRPTVVSRCGAITPQHSSEAGLNGPAILGTGLSWRTVLCDGQQRHTAFAAGKRVICHHFTPPAHQQDICLKRAHTSAASGGFGQAEKVVLHDAGRTTCRLPPVTAQCRLSLVAYIGCQLTAIDRILSPPVAVPPSVLFSACAASSIWTLIMHERAQSNRSHRLSAVIPKGHSRCRGPDPQFTVHGTVDRSSQVAALTTFIHTHPSPTSLLPAAGNIAD